MRFSKTTLAIALAAAGAFAIPAQAVQPGSQIITIATPIGSGHEYEGVLDVCNGKFRASGTTQGATATYDEMVKGTVTDTTLTYTSVYYGEVNDGLGTWDPHMYSVEATVAGGTWSGTYTVTKTSVDPPYDTVTETGALTGTINYDGALVGSQFRNHGQCIRSFTKP